MLWPIVNPGLGLVPSCDFLRGFLVACGECWFLVLIFSVGGSIGSGQIILMQCALHVSYCRRGLQGLQLAILSSQILAWKCAGACVANLVTQGVISLDLGWLVVNGIVHG